MHFKKWLKDAIDKKNDSTDGQANRTQRDLQLRNATLYFLSSNTTAYIQHLDEVIIKTSYHGFSGPLLKTIGSALHRTGRKTPKALIPIYFTFCTRSSQSYFSNIKWNRCRKNLSWLFGYVSLSLMNRKTRGTLCSCSEQSHRPYVNTKLVLVLFAGFIEE